MKQLCSHLTIKTKQNLEILALVSHAPEGTLAYRKAQKGYLLANTLLCVVSNGFHVEQFFKKLMQYENMPSRQVRLWSVSNMHY